MKKKQENTHHPSPFPRRVKCTAADAKTPGNTTGTEHNISIIFYKLHNALPSDNNAKDGNEVILPRKIEKMTRTPCVVPGCRNNSSKNKDLTFFHITKKR
jgi:hypothetical protein